MKNKKQKLNIKMITCKKGSIYCPSNRINGKKPLCKHVERERKIMLSKKINKEILFKIIMGSRLKDRTLIPTIVVKDKQSMVRFHSNPQNTQTKVGTLNDMLNKFESLEEPKCPECGHIGKHSNSCVTVE